MDPSLFNEYKIQSSTPDKGQSQNEQQCAKYQIQTGFKDGPREERRERRRELNRIEEKSGGRGRRTRMRKKRVRKQQERPWILKGLANGGLPLQGPLLCPCLRRGRFNGSGHSAVAPDGGPVGTSSHYQRERGRERWGMRGGLRGSALPLPPTATCLAECCACTVVIPRHLGTCYYTAS